MPNTSRRTRTKTIRIRNEVADYFEGKALNRAVEDVYDKICTEELRFTGEGIEIIDKYDMKPFEKVCGRLRVNPHRMLANLVVGLEKYYKENGRKKKSEKAQQ